jgi:hypothetical protein
MLRKIILLGLVMAAFLLMSGCHLKEKIGESITEKAVEKATGDEADIDIDDGDISIKGEDGSKVTVDEEEGLKVEGEDGSVVQSGGDYEWPEGQAADYVPKFDGGKITYIMNSDEAFMVYVEETKMDDYKDYVKKVTEKGFTNDKFESSASDMELYQATSGDGVIVTVSYMQEEVMLTITAEASKEQFVRKRCLL